MNLFDILGPIMVGPSSSHTAGAVRIGNVGMKLLGDVPKKASIYLHGSFADTGKGHGTDLAIIAGLLGMEPDDMRIPHSMEIAKEKGLEFSFFEKQIREAHPNTAYLQLEHANGKRLDLQACSLGGGRILINEIDGLRANFHGVLEAFCCNQTHFGPFFLNQCVGPHGCSVGQISNLAGRRLLLP